MQWIFVLCGCMFLLSLIATSQVWTVSLKAGLYTYKAVERTGHTTGFVSIRGGRWRVARRSPPAFGFATKERRQPVSAGRKRRYFVSHAIGMESVAGDVVMGVASCPLASNL
jgi:hypothetical protein